jgi:hypothetical protein
MVVQLKISDWIGRILQAVYLVYCRCRFGRGTQLISLSRFKFAIVDTDDYQRLNSFKWHTKRGENTWYAIRWAKVGDEKHKVVWMHQMIIKTKKRMLVNLRPATYSQNICNRKKWKGPCSSRFKGVTYYKWGSRRKRWFTRICVNQRKIPLGYFLTEVEAAKAYDEAAKKYHGEFARLNFT